MLFEMFGTKQAELEAVDSIPELWKKAVKLLRNTDHDVEKIKTMVPEKMRPIIPHFNTIQLENLITYVNTIRSLLVLHAQGVTSEVKAPLIYIRASQTVRNAQPIPDNVAKRIIFTEMEGDHFSILRKPQVQELARIVERGLKRLQKKALNLS